MTTPTTAGHDIPVRKLVIALAVVVVGLVVWFAAVAPASHDKAVKATAARRATCVSVPEATTRALTAGLDHLGDRVVRSLLARPSTDGWTMVSADLAAPDVPGGFTGDLATWRVRDDVGLVIQSIDKNAEEASSFPHAPDGVKVADEGGFDSRWCAKDAALNP